MFIIPLEFRTNLGVYKLADIHQPEPHPIWPRPPVIVDYVYILTCEQIGRGGYTHPLARAGEVWTGCAMSLNQWLNMANYYVQVEQERELDDKRRREADRARRRLDEERHNLTP